ncbi:hypothetical protein [Corynebacterium pygosceleis]|uniref:hypothetical protein n=1 Tax=Corynebacterium pygosceleis TaxID=2800406 RepID=UPI0020061490|nr:hypothetical protein [Corynebacterium pygosceleis]MCK7676397.1 hypothetical protein [Corynebacterium pygosceleis]
MSMKNQEPAWEFIPPGLGLTELFHINVTLRTIRQEILKGRVSGVVIDRAINEILERIDQPVTGRA